MKVVGLTGGIASGKSTVAALLAKKGAYLIDADQIAREIIENNIKIKKELIAFFGDEVLDEKGEIDRRKLADAVFFNPTKLKFLNNLTHPPIILEIRKKIDDKKKTGFDGLVILDIPLLIEANLLSLVDLVVVVVADEGMRMMRLIKRGLSVKEARARMRAQASDKKRIEAAGCVIENNGALQELKSRVDELWKKIVKS